MVFGQEMLPNPFLTVIKHSIFRFLSAASLLSVFLSHHLLGWLQKEMKTNAKSTSLKLKKRWFVLTHNSLDYYKSSERNSSKMGTLVLNSLCSVIQPDERVHRETGEKREMR